MRTSQVFKISFFFFLALFLFVLAMYIANLYRASQEKSDVLGVANTSWVTPESVERNVQGDRVLDEEGFVR